MAVRKIEVFLASRFDEFADIRRRLKTRIDEFPAIPLQTVDFNDGRMSHRPPKERCVQAVKQAEILVLMVGGTYGGIPQGENLSYTHLEYRAALEDEDNTIILPFFIGKNYQAKLNNKSSDAGLAKWQAEIADNHTPGFISEEDPELVARIIFDWILKALLDMGTESTQQRVEDYFETDYGFDSPSAGVSLDEMSEYDRRIGRSTSESSSDDRQDTAPSMARLADIMENPARTAREEQLRLAEFSLGLGDRATAIYHYRNAVTQTPNHFKSNHNLARILLATNRRKDAAEALRYSLRAARLAEHESQLTFAAGSLIIAAQSSAKLGNYNRGLEMAQAAVEKAPTFSRAHIELACQYAHQSRVAEALKTADEVFRIHASSISILDHEPAIQGLGKAYREYKKERLNKLRQGIVDVLEAENEMGSLVNTELEEATEDSPADILAKVHSYPLFQLLAIGKDSVRRQFETLRELAKLLGTNTNNHRAVLENASILLGAAAAGGSDTQQNLERFIDSQKSRGLLRDLILGSAAGAFVVLVVIGLLPLSKIILVLAGVPAYFIFNDRKNRPYRKAQLCLNRYISTRNRLNETVKQFTQSLQLFETKSLPHRIYCPWSGNNRYSEGDIRRAALGKDREGVFGTAFSEDVLPDEIIRLTHVKILPPRRASLYRAVTNDAGELVLSRGRVFFKNAPLSRAVAEHSSQDVQESFTVENAQGQIVFLD